VGQTVHSRSAVTYPASSRKIFDRGGDRSAPARTLHAPYRAAVEPRAGNSPRPQDVFKIRRRARGSCVSGTLTDTGGRITPTWPSACGPAPATSTVAAD
jgi:hypothetical protein